MLFFDSLANPCTSLPATFLYIHFPQERRELPKDKSEIKVQTKLFILKDLQGSNASFRHAGKAGKDDFMICKWHPLNRPEPSLPVFMGEENRVRIRQKSEA